MFTGIVEEVGKVLSVLDRKIYVECSFIKEIVLGQSICHNGVCLTVFDIDKDGYWIEIGQETFEKTNLREIFKKDKNVKKTGSYVNINLERSVLNNGRFEGHIVQGHIDETAEIIKIKKDKNSYIFDFKTKSKLTEKLTVEKGSICINGVSLTVNKCLKNKFNICVIPYTYKNTNFKELKLGDIVNLEYDILGKYIIKNKDE